MRQVVNPLECPSCGEANRAGARFCVGCGAALARRCESCGSALSAGARFCDECGAPLREPATSVEAGRKTVSVVFSDLAGSTAMQDALDPESVRRIMARYYEVMRAVVGRHNGYIEKFIGDAVVAVFGKPVVREDDAVRAVRCALAMVAELEVLNDELEQAWGVRLKMRTGVNTGELVVSSDGILVGDTMNTAARLEQAAPAGEVLIGEATWRLVRQELAVEPIAALELKGKSWPVRAWRVVSGADRPAGDPAGEAPLVGRGEELDRLRGVLEQVIAARGCRLVTVVGSPGLGKSRLASEFARDVAGRARVVYGHCEPSGEGSTFLPVAEIIRELAGIKEADDPELALDKLRALGSQDDPDRERLVERTAALLGIGEMASAQETFWALRRGLEVLGRERPLVIVLDDLHWAQPMLLDLVEHLVEWISDAPVLLIALARPELREVREVLTAAGRRASDVIELLPLGPGESRTLVDGLLGSADLPSELLERILQPTEGNPLFLGELIRMLIDDGALVRGGEGWSLAAGTDTVEVPPTIQALLAARIERLRAEERAVVERAAVIGKQFYRGAVAELLTPSARPAIDGHLESLRRKEMVEPEGVYWIDEPVYRFHHVLIRDAAYRLLLKEARAVLHERFADWLQEKAGELVGEYEEVIAFHLEQAHSYRRELGPLDDAGRALGARAAARLHSAGRRALSREDLAAAANLLTRALATEGGTEQAILWDLAEVELSTGDAPRASDVVTRYAATASGEARAVVLEAQLANLRGDDEPEATADAVRAAAVALRELGDGHGEAKAWHVAAQTDARLGRVGQVETALDQALTAARAVDDRRRTTAVLAAAPRAALWGPSTVVRASGRCLDVVRILRMTPGNRHVEVIALRCQAVLEAMRGRVDAAREILAGARATLEELGLSLELYETQVHAGIVELLAGEPAAVEQMQAALQGFESLGADAAAALAAALLAHALVARREQGDAEAALAHVAFAERHGGGDLRAAIIAASAQGEALAQTGEIVAAVASARRAVELVEPTDALADKADALMALARVLLASGDRDGARDAAQAAHDAYEAKGHTVGIERAAALSGEAVSTVGAGDTAPATDTVLGDRELGGVAGEVRREQVPLRLFAEYADRLHRRELDGALDLYTPELEMLDYRTAIAQGHIRGREANRAFMQSMLDASPDLRLDVEEVLACDERVVALRVAARGHGRDGGGELEVPAGWIGVVQGGRFTRVELYDDDSAGMLARFIALGGRRSALLGDRPSERVTAEFTRCYNERDFEAMARVVTDDCYWIDHRRMGWEEVRGREQYMAFVRSALPSPNLRYQVDEVIAADDRVLVSRCSWRGRGVKAGQLELRVGTVTLTENGRLLGVESYEPEDLEAMLARFAELRGGEQGGLGSTPIEQGFATYIDCFNARDVDGILALYADDYVLRDHRAISTMEVAGKHALRELFESSFAVSGDLRCEVDEVLACSDRVIAVRVAYRGHLSDDDGGGTAENALGIVTMFGDDGLAVSTDQYEYDDGAAMLARFTELAGRRNTVLGNRPPERSVAEHFRLTSGRDYDAIERRLAPDCVWTDHRVVAWETARGRDSVMALLRSALESSPEQVNDVQEVIACDDRVIAVRVAWRGTGRKAGAWETAVGAVVALGEAGLWQSIDFYGPDDRQAIVARYAELGGGLSVLADSPAERVVRRFLRHYAAQELAPALELTRDDFLWTDHRNLGWEPIRGRVGIARLLKSSWEGTLDMRIEIDDVLACDGRQLALRFRWVGHNARGGLFELPAGQVIVTDGERYASIDQYDARNREAILARFAELSGGSAPVGHPRAPERLLAEYGRRLAQRDVQAIVELFDAGYRMHDHRPTVSRDARRGAGTRSDLESTLSISPDIRFEIEEVLACDDRVIAARVAYRGHAADGGGEFEVELGWVVATADGVGCMSDTYEPEDRRAMIARYVELGGGLAPLGDSPPERACAEHSRRLAQRDLDAIVAQFRDDYMMRDHRSTVSVDVPRAEVRASFEALFSVTETLRIETDEVLACDDRVIARRIAHRGTAADGGGPMEVLAAWVTVVEDGLLVSTDVFDYNDDAGVLARFAELSAEPDPQDDRSPERWVVQWIDAYNRHDADAVAALVSHDFVLVDHRANGWGTIEGPDALREHHVAGFRVSPDIRMGIDSVVAGDDRAGAVCFTYRGHMADGGGEFEIAVGYVTLVKDGRALRTDVYDPDDRAAMLARFAELAGTTATVLGDRPSERRMAEVQRAMNARDYERLGKLVADDWQYIDHRALRLHEDVHGREGCIALMRSMFDASPGIRLDFDEVLAVDDRLIAAQIAVRGHGRKAGEHEVAVGAVYLFEDGLWVSGDFFELDDRQATIARYVTLGGGLSALGATAAEQVWAEFARCYARQASSGLLRCVSDEIAFTDHRPLGWDPVGGAEGYVALMRTGWNALDIRMEPDEVLAANDRVVAVRFRWVGTGDSEWGGGPFALAVGHVMAVQDGRIISVDQYEAEDRTAMLARFAELSDGAAAARRVPTAGEMLAEEIRRYNLHDIDGCSELFAEEFILVDHRNLGWGTIAGREGMRVNYLAAFEGSTDIHVDLEEILACDDRVLVARTTWRGHANDGGGAFEMAIGYVGRYEGGRAISYDLYEPDDTEAMLARYSELGGRLDG